LIAILFGVGQTAAHLRTDETDCWLFAYYADQMLQGRQLYGELWDNKPPGIFWINALGLQLGGGYGGVIALCVLASAVALGVFFLIARKWYGCTPAIIGTVLASLYLSHQMYRGGTNRPETFVVLFDLAAVFWYQRGLRSPSARCWAASASSRSCCARSCWPRSNSIRARLRTTAATPGWSSPSAVRRSATAAAY